MMMASKALCVNCEEHHRLKLKQVCPECYAQLLKALHRAEQTLRNLGIGALSGDCRTIALNEAANIRAALAGVEGEEGAHGQAIV